MFCEDSPGVQARFRLGKSQATRGSNWRCSLSVIPQLPACSSFGRTVPPVLPQPLNIHCCNRGYFSLPKDLYNSPRSPPFPLFHSSLNSLSILLTPLSHFKLPLSLLSLAYFFSRVNQLSRNNITNIITTTTSPSPWRPGHRRSSRWAM